MVTQWIFNLWVTFVDLSCRVCGWEQTGVIPPRLTFSPVASVSQCHWAGLDWKPSSWPRSDSTTASASNSTIGLVEKLFVVEFKWFIFWEIPLLLFTVEYSPLLVPHSDWSCSQSSIHPTIYHLHINHSSSIGSSLIYYLSIHQSISPYIHRTSIYSSTIETSTIHPSTIHPSYWSWSFLTTLCFTFSLSQIADSQPVTWTGLNRFQLAEQQCPLPGWRSVTSGYERWGATHLCDCTPRQWCTTCSTGSWAAPLAPPRRTKCSSAPRGWTPGWRWAGRPESNRTWTLPESAAAWSGSCCILGHGSDTGPVMEYKCVFIMCLYGHLQSVWIYITFCIMVYNETLQYL